MAERSRVAKHRDALVALLLLCMSLLVYAPVRDHAFVSYDDIIYIVDNPNLRAPLDAQAVWHAFSTAYESNWIPLTWLSLHVDHSLYGLEPAGYHWTNAALHATSAALLFLALSAMTGARAPSAFVAAVFATHPLHVESVAWATERKDTLSGVFWMAALLAYAGYAKTASRQARAFWYACVAGSFSLALLAKPMAVTLPFSLLLLDYWPLRRLRSDGATGWPQALALRGALAEKLPLFALAAAASAVTVAVQRDTGAMSTGDLLPLGLRVANALDAYRWYAFASIWPLDLAVFYPHPLVMPDAARWLGAGAGIAIALGIALRSATTHPYGLVGLLWFLGTLVPVIGLVQAGMQSRADRYMYVPLIGIAVVFAWTALDLARTPARRRLAAALGVCVVAVLSLLARAQLGHWRDSEHLYRRALEVTKENFLAHSGLAGVWLESGDLERAELHAREAIRIKPRWPEPRITLGDILATRGSPEAATDEYDRALRLAPEHARAHANLAVVLIDAGRGREAIAHLDNALALQRNTGFAHLHALRGQALAQVGDLTASIAAYERALGMRPEWAEARANLGGVLMQAQRFEQAQTHLQRARALGLRSAELELDLARALAELGDVEQAIAHYRTGLEGIDRWHPAANNLAWLLATRTHVPQQDAKLAMALALESIAQRGRIPAILDTLAAAHAAAGDFGLAVEVGDEALAAAIRDGSEALVDAIRDRVSGYRSGRPYVGPPAPPTR